jgi:hypothetical protein
MKENDFHFTMKENDFHFTIVGVLLGHYHPKDHNRYKWKV